MNLHLIDRRCFLRAGTTAIGTLAASGLPGRQGRAEPAGRLDRIGLQLYTVRHDFIRNVDETLAAVARVGYSEVELFSPYAPQGWTPGRLRSALDQAGLSAPSTHVGGNLLQNGWEKHLEAALVLGCRYIVCGSPERDALHTMRDWHELADLLNRAGEAARKAGLQLGYHNHDFEFVPVEGQIPYNVLLAKTDPALMQLELDLYWITKAGGDPLAYFERWPGRFFAVHIKDMDATPQREMSDVGAGIIDFARILAKSRDAGFKHYFVEHDKPAPPALESVRRSFAHLQELRF
jgi:sugar phosphate isomerase/epimerase